ncbi:M20/M25/M40 family metallo-hydrolase [Sphingomonas sp. R1]|uniref:M20/M25/M40 family metallo-hydrolase n=1 Tax=Sphingomonas sp. R1 TaxID=399176 RepID=UPI0022245D0E|nr:M20/M25/M40 family metallo-hydrolase [Sphingomonas sp. R1]UYY76095.1 M20/M25/M40 family metallo-hydrolase [Sphingomonas sp. R1]
MKSLLAATTGLVLAVATPAVAQTRPDQAAFFELYKELVETNTVVNVGSCTQAAEQIAARMKAAGFKDEQLTLFATPEHPKDGGLVAVYPGTSKKAKPLLLLAHIDVVAAKREDWTRDPFKLIEENGYYYARGTSDDKAMAATWADTLIRFRQAGYKPKRTVKLALTCGEETTWAFNGAEWLSKNKRDLIDAEFALNEGGGGKSDGHGKVLVQQMQVGEKAVQNYRLETSNPGGHSSIPVPDNAIYALADALVKIRAYDFPLELSDTTRAYFAKAGAARSDAMGKAMVAIAANPSDKTAETLLNTDRIYHSMLRTTCVATLLEGGHANNALPQRAAANINCRIFPGHSSEEVQKALIAAIGDATVTVTMVPPIRPIAKPPALDPLVVGPAEKLVAKYFPGVPLVPTMMTGATDAIFLAAAGIPTYGVPGTWGDPDGNGVHGLNERIEVRSLYTGRDYLFDLVKAYAEQE